MSRPYRTGEMPELPPELEEDTAPRWPLVPQPRVPGFATMEWNIMEGTTWFSEEWKAMTQSDYDPTRPNDQEWWMERVSANDMNRIYKSCLALHAGFLDDSEIVYHLRRGDGSLRTLLARSVVTARTPDGAPALASGFAVDITDIASHGVELRENAHASEIDYQSMLENSPDLFLRFDANLKPVYVNPAVNRYLGGMYNTPGQEARLTGDYRDVFRKNVTRVFEENAVVREELRLSMSDGGEIIGDCSFWPEYDAQGNVRFAMVQLRDITAQRRMEQRLKFNERRLDAIYRLTLMENASEPAILRYVMDSVLELSKSRGGFIFFPNGNGTDAGHVLWSDEHLETVGAEHLPADHLPEDVVRLMTGADGRRDYRRIMNGDGKTPVAVLFDGKRPIFRNIIAPVLEGNRVVCMAGVSNKATDYEESDLQQLETFINSAWLILRRRRYVRELRQAKDAAETANKAKNAFLANVSHELRTPLNGVLSMLQLIDTLPMGNEHRDYLQTAQASGKALLRIISDLLDYSSMEAGKMPLTEEAFDCAATVRSALGMFAEEIARMGLDFSYRIDPSIPRRLLGDEARVRQIVFNIVGNAMKFTPQGSIDVTLTPAADNPTDMFGVVLEVSDTGIGIPPSKLDDIFNAFTQVENAQRKKYPGTGLGLSIVKHLADMMNGRVDVESELGKGAKVRCSLYFSIPGPTEVFREVPAARPEPLPERTLDILVAEDDTVGSKAIKAFLQKRGHRVACVEDGVKALEALQLYPFHCLFTDITMPNIDGLELVQRIRKGLTEDCPPSGETRGLLAETFGRLNGKRAGASIPVIAVSAHSMIGDKDRFLAMGMDYYISKPIDRSELDNALRFVQQRIEAP